MIRGKKRPRDVCDEEEEENVVAAKRGRRGAGTSSTTLDALVDDLALTLAPRLTRADRVALAAYWPRFAVHASGGSSSSSAEDETTRRRRAFDVYADGTVAQIAHFYAPGSSVHDDGSGLVQSQWLGLLSARRAVELAPQLVQQRLLLPWTLLALADKDFAVLLQTAHATALAWFLSTWRSPSPGHEEWLKNEDTRAALLGRGTEPDLVDVVLDHCKLCCSDAVRLFETALNAHKWPLMYSLFAQHPRWNFGHRYCIATRVDGLRDTITAALIAQNSPEAMDFLFSREGMQCVRVTRAMLTAAEGAQPPLAVSAARLRQHYVET